MEHNNITQDQAIKLGRAMQSLDSLNDWMNKLRMPEDRELILIVHEKLETLKAKCRYAEIQD